MATTAQRLAIIPAFVRRVGRDLIQRYNHAQHLAQAQADVETEFGPP